MSNYMDKIIESHTPEYPDPSDVARILIKEILNCGNDCWCHFDDTSGSVWVEVAPDKNGLLVNLTYPYKELPEIIFPQNSIHVPSSREIVTLKKKGFLSSGCVTYRASREDIESIISFIVNFFKSLSEMGQDFRLSGSLQS